jgi:hypothetical protein
MGAVNRVWHQRAQPAWDWAESPGRAGESLAPLGKGGGAGGFL